MQFKMAFLFTHIENATKRNANFGSVMKLQKFAKKYSVYGTKHL